jgi:hypothetical protein
VRYIVIFSLTFRSRSYTPHNSLIFYPPQQ